MNEKTQLLLIMQNKATGAIQNTLEGQTYSEENIEKWGSSIIKNLLQEMNAISKGRYKFVANVIIFSSKNQCVNNTQMALFDSEKDEKIITKWGNSSMQCILSLWAFKTRFG